MYVVIMAGGGGTRLAPLSLPDRPKPFLPLLADWSLLQRTVRRVLDGSELGLQPQDVTVVTERRYTKLAERQLPGIPLLAEPRGRNTAAAIALAALQIDRPADEIMLVLPADHTIADEAGFRRVLRAAHDELAHGALGVEAPMVTLGVQVDRPATEYGYLIPDIDRAQFGALRSYVLKAFEEKPTALRAAELRDLPAVAWNAGIFMWSRQTVLAALARYTALLTLLQPSLASPRALDAAYERIQPVSIDFAVMEGAARDGQVLMAAMNVGWSDLGTWTSLLHELSGGYSGAAHVVPPGETVELGGEDLLVRRDDGRLVLDVGPAGTIRSQQPMGLLPAARRHADAVAALLERVDRQEGRA